MQLTERCFTLCFCNVIKTMRKRKKENDTFLRKRSEEKNSFNIITSVDGKERLFPVKLRLEEESFQ